jgi:hypothetical protein
MSWAVHQEGTATAWIKHDMYALLRPLQTTRRQPAARRRK